MKGEELNKQQRLLQYPLSDFGRIVQSLNDFGKYVQFWEFTEKWFRLSDSWENFTFDEIFRTEMSIEIKNQITHTCQEGKLLLEKLRLMFIADSNSSLTCSKISFLIDFI